MLLRTTGVAPLLLAVCPALSAADPDFSGEWKLDGQRSTIRSMPAPPCEAMKIQHKAGKFSVAGLHPPCSEVRPALFVRERKETASPHMERLTLLKWEGEALLLNTVVDGARGTSYTQMDRWRLSRDGRTLRIRRQVVRLSGEVESELVYERRL